MLEIRITQTSATSNMSVQSVDLTGMGWGYGDPGWITNGITATGGGGTGFAGDYFISGAGTVTAVEITNGGSGYTSAPTIGFTDSPSTPSSDATATATVGEEFFVSDVGHSGANFGAETGSSYYREFVKTPPTFTLGPTTGGWIHVQSGTITLVNRPFDDDHPFGSKHFSTLLTNTGNATDRPIIEIKDETKYPLFRGTMYLTKISPTDLTFSLEGKKYNQQVLTTQTVLFRQSSGGSIDSIGSEPIPFSHGVIQMQGDIKCNTANVSDPKIWNPGFDSSETIKVYEEGTSDVFDTTESDDTILNLTGTADPTVKQYRLNGTGVNGTTLDDLFAALLSGTPGATFGLPVLNYSTTKAPNVDSLDISVYQTEQILCTELAGEVAKSCNYQYIIHVPVDGSTYGGEATVIIDRANAPTSTDLADSDVENVSFNLGYPIQAVIGTFTVNNGPWSTPGEWAREGKQAIRSDNLDQGKIVKIKLPALNFDQISGFQTVVDAIRDVEKKPTASILVKGIKSEYMPGDRFTANRSEDHVKVTLTVRSLTFDWKSRTTTISGDCTLSPFENE